MAVLVGDSFDQGSVVVCSAVVGVCVEADDGWALALVGVSGELPFGAAGCAADGVDAAESEDGVCVLVEPDAGVGVVLFFEFDDDEEEVGEVIVVVAFGDLRVGFAGVVVEGAAAELFDVDAVDGVAVEHVWIVLVVADVASCVM